VIDRAGRTGYIVIRRQKRIYKGHNRSSAASKAWYLYEGDVVSKAKTFLLLSATIAVILFIMLYQSGEKYKALSDNGTKIIKLPGPKHDSDTSVEEALLKRRSVRAYADRSLKLEKISQLLWAAQGITDQRGFRTAPSAGALYPLEVYLVSGNVPGLQAGIYRYRPHTHSLERHATGDRRNELSDAALGQEAVRNAPAVIVFAGECKRTTVKYGERGIRYVHMEAGHAAQNVLLEAASLSLGAVVIGAFHDRKVKKVMEMPESEEPLYIMPAGEIAGN
jgi:SagB-type dehydrogenase family enzyme